MNDKSIWVAAIVVLVTMSVAHAQQAAKIARIGFLGAPTAIGWVSKLDAFRAGLRELGYVEGKNLLIETRWADGHYERLPALAAELVALKVDVIVTHAGPGIRAAKKATSTIPIVIAAVGDAVAGGYVDSLAQPGGNVTGSSFFRPELAAKRVELINEIFPRARRIAVLINSDGENRTILSAMRETVKSLKLSAVAEFSLRDPAQFESALIAMGKQRVDALVVNEDPMFVANARTIAELTAGRRLRSIGFTELGESGGLLAYGANIDEMHRRAATFVDKILKGRAPAELPVEQPMKFEFVVNLKTAKQIGVTIPPNVLVRADRVIR